MLFCYCSYVFYYVAILFLLLPRFPPTKLRRFLKPCKSFRVFFHFILFPRALCVPFPCALYPVSPFIMYLSPVHYSLRLSGIVGSIRLVRLVVLVLCFSGSPGWSGSPGFRCQIRRRHENDTKTRRRRDGNETKTRRKRSVSKPGTQAYCLRKIYRLNPLKKHSKP